MIQSLATKSPKSIAYIFFLLFLSSLAPVYGGSGHKEKYLPESRNLFNKNVPFPSKTKPLFKNNGAIVNKEKNNAIADKEKDKRLQSNAENGDGKADIGGPSQPEMSSFKSVGTDNMVNLFTGDFSYNIPLMDVGGYPINIFYDGGITMEQEASWVGLGWNINPGTVSRNMRGVPDDFDGTDTLTQVQNMKPNNTWGVSLGANAEIVGLPLTIGSSLGVSFNNYLGPALELTGKGSVNFSIASKATSEKNANLGVSAGLNASLSSRYGLTFSPNVSLSATASRDDRSATFGLGLSTSYNSRSGIKGLHLGEQLSFSNHAAARKKSEQSSQTMSLFSTSISYTKPSYIPSLRLPLTNTAFSGHFQLGTGIFGGYGSIEAEVYKQKSEVATADITQRKPLVGYLHYQKAINSPNAVMDFTRFNDGEVTPNTPIISAPQYSYDVFSIQGEGTGGTIRAYRNDQGYVRDNSSRTQDKNISVGADVGPPGHFGANFNTIQTPSAIGEWGVGNKLRNAIGFREAKDTFENVYFRNPGETSVLIKDQYKKIGGLDLVRFKLAGTNASPTIEPVLEQYSRTKDLLGTTSLLTPDLAERKKRTQVTSFLTAEEATKIGLDTAIKSYDKDSVLNFAKNLKYSVISRVSDYRKKNHISQVNVTEASGKRYIYGVPVYNVEQKDFSFTIGATTEANADDDKQAFVSTEAVQLHTGKKDGYIQKTETPAYAHSFLMSGLLSPDYVDVTGDGITEDDIGDAVKFNYTRYADHLWRTPLTSGATPTANFNAGKRTESKDDKGIISYGKRESWYVHSIESKTMIALFTLEDRKDGKGTVDSLKGVNATDNSLKRLKKIDLFSKADLKKNGLANAKPIKTVWFAYSYSLCSNTPDNAGGTEMINGVNVNATNGKLTLDSIYFTFNGKTRINKNKYVFSYGGTATNPAYEFNASDRWGNYKPYDKNPSDLKNSIYPYSIQDKAEKVTIDSSVAAWSLKKIALPSGGQIEVEYESDDYAFVQNRRAAAMMEIVGLGNDPLATPSNKLYAVNGPGGFTDNEYVFIKVPETCVTKEEVFQKYIQGFNQLAFKVAVNMPKGIEYVNSYAGIEDWGVSTGNRIWVRLKTTDGISPLTLTALEFLREQLPGQAFEGYDVSESSGLKQAGEMLIGMLQSLSNAFNNPLDQLRGYRKAQTINQAQSFVRLNDPDGYKYGGGQRVKSIKLKDNWQAMTGQYTSEYGQVYHYTTEEVFNGVTRKISSGVASYEPSIGGEENPFQSIEQVSNKLPLGPTSYGAIEMPILDAFFPAPLVGYSKVTVKALRKGYVDTTLHKSRSGIGKQVSEFYTAKDFPVYYNHTSFDNFSDKQQHNASTAAFFYKYGFDSRALSQGFIVETNDMHGKMKSQSSYAETDSVTPINYVENFYRNTGKQAAKDSFDFIYGNRSGVIEKGVMGIDVELMTDTREFSVRSTSLEVQGQVDLFPVIFPFWLPFIWPVSGESENTYRAVTTTKVINYHGILDSVIAIDKGSRISTKNMVYDSETGDLIISKTNNEFDDPLYNVNYPAYWAYSGMGLAYKNINAVFDNVNFLDGQISSGIAAADLKKYFESGDELYLINTGTQLSGNCASLTSSADIRLLWAFDKNKNVSPLTSTAPDFVFMDSAGKLYNRNGVKFRIVRSGRRNLLGSSVASAVLMANPIVTTGNTRKLTITSTSKVINASAIEYREKWQTDNDIIRKYSLVYNLSACTSAEVPDCNGYLEKNINPYRKGLMGNFRTNQSKVFYGNRADTITAATILRQNGYLKDFVLYWSFNTSNNLVPLANAKWVWNSQITRFNSRGLELETKDALNIYTAAQYGYNKTMPVAIVNNARFEEMFYEGFEDKDYQESINNNAGNSCARKHIDFTDVSHSQIANTDLLNFNAHSGKYVLRVDSNAIAVKTIPVKTGFIDSFSVMWKKDTLKDLYITGGLLTKISAQPSSAPAYAPDFAASNLGMSLDFPAHNVTGEIIGNTVKYYHMYKTIQYTKVTTPNTYTFNLSTGQRDIPLNYPEEYIFNMSAIWVSIKKLNGDPVATFSYYSTNLPQIEHVFLTCDTYIIETLCSVDIQRPYDGSVGFHAFSAEFAYSSNVNTVSYKSLVGQNLCIFTKPIAATESMLNPTFTIPANRKMLFSAWVKENCDNRTTGTTCNNKVTLQYNGGSSQVDEFKPAGPIIEGWQRYEGYFTAPASATQMTMNLVNTSGLPIYFDDIRIHPYNANMKSYVYDPMSLRLVAELDANNYASFYEYDEEGTLIRTKAETKEGIKTINETRSFKQRAIKEVK